MGRPGQPEEVSPAFVFLAARDSSYITGQVIRLFAFIRVLFRDSALQTIHVNGGVIVNA
jgi:NAD(P)-dependent dehydrogenase (short-subunit alcohol dehydrogenase family)